MIADDIRASRAWIAVALCLAAASLLAWPLPAAWLDWQPELAWREPWRAFTGALVHWSPMHLAANLGAMAIVAALGVAARVPASLAVAWCVAWPLTQLGLLVQPSLAHYGGLSGVLHAGIAVVIVWLLAVVRGTRRAIGATLLAGLLAKLWLEQPWGAPLREGDGWDIALAPIAHATGAMAGLLCASAALLLHRPANESDGAVPAVHS